MKKQFILPFAIIFIVLFLDQWFKVYIKTHFYLDEIVYPIKGIEWFKLHFVENPGMAFGLEFGGMIGKYILTILRIAAVTGIGWYLIKLIKQKSHLGVIISISFLFAGAIGNIIDSSIYGLLFDKGTIYHQEYEGWIGYSGLATWNSSGYTGVFQGCVVDMLSFPLYNGFLPSWIPIWGGEHFVFFRPIFNLADSYITIGVILLLIFYNKSFLAKPKNEISN